MDGQCVRGAALEERKIRGGLPEAEARKGLGEYFEFYNQGRRHQGLDSKPPDMFFWATLPKEQVAA